jgi:hypothetical protein
MTIRAWKTVAMGTTCIVAAETRAKAIMRTIKSAHEAGYDLRWLEVRAVRAPQHDRWAKGDVADRCWDEQYLPRVTR